MPRGKTALELQEEAMRNQREIEEAARLSNQRTLNPVLVPKQQTGRYYIRYSIGNWLELAGAAMAVTAVYLLAGLAWCLVAGGAVLLIGAEFIYFDSRVRIPLPHIPHPIRRFRTKK